MPLTYGLRTPQDLLNKLKRDAALLNDEVTSDRFFNFVVTGYSLIDWIKNGSKVPGPTKSAVLSMYGDRWVKICGDLATASKHFILTKRKPITIKAESRQGRGHGRWGMGTWGIGEEDIQVELEDGTAVLCLELVTRVIDSWEQFFNTHQI